MRNKRVAREPDLRHDCAMSNMSNKTFQRIAAAITHLADNVERQPGLAELAAVAGLSPAHFSRQFRAHAGLSPKRFLEQLTIERLKQRLVAGEDLLQAQLETGLSGAGRVHDHFVSLEATTPGQFRQRGRGLEIRHAFHSGPHGEMLIATTERGLCFLALSAISGRKPALQALGNNWPEATLIEDAKAGLVFAQQVQRARLAAPLPLHVSGTNFQVQVWRALLRIPVGRLATYTEVAQACGRPNSVRAVANAIGANPIALVIPCHRVIRKSGALGGYRWSLASKVKLIVAEDDQQTARP